MSVLQPRWLHPDMETGQAMAAAGGLWLVEHDVEFVMAQCDRIVVLNLGRVIAEGTPAEVRARREVQQVAIDRLRGSPHCRRDVVRARAHEPRDAQRGGGGARGAAP